MEHYLQPLMEFLRLHPGLGILFVFMIAFIESLPILGTLFPGSITMTAVGALVGAAVLPPIATCVLAVIGAFSGDCLGFWLGNKYHEKIREVWPLNKLRKYLAYSENFFSRHGGKSIIIGRFIGPTRAAMPLIAGILRYTWKQFLPSAIFAAILWSLVYMAPGVILGALAMEFPHGDMTKVFFLGLAVIAGLWLIFWILQYFFRQLTRAINRSIQAWWNWLSRPKPGLFVRLIRNQQHPHDFHQLKIVLIFSLMSLWFLLLWYDVVRHGFITQINQPIFYLSQSFRTPALDHFWTLFTVLGSPEALLVACLLATLGLIFYKQWRAAFHIAFLGIISAGATEVIKKLYFSARPTGFVLVDLSSSFPSGHTTLSVAIFGFLAFLTAKIISRTWRRLCYTFFIALILLISGSRIFLGQHWFTDILGGWLLGLSALLLVTLSYRRLPVRHSILAVTMVSALIPCLLASFITFKSTLRHTQPYWPTIKLSLNQWWQYPTAVVPLYRQDRFGRIAQPFNVQWVGNFNDIQLFLQSHGWQFAERFSRMHSAVQRFTSLQPEFNLPLLPWLYHNQPPAAFFIKHLNNSANILELRLWPSAIQFTDSPLPLWLGILTYHTPAEKILHFPHRYMRLQSGNVLIDMSPQLNDFQFQLVHIPIEQQPETIRAMHWDGNIFILSIH